MPCPFLPLFLQSNWIRNILQELFSPTGSTQPSLCPCWMDYFPSLASHNPLAVPVSHASVWLHTLCIDMVALPLLPLASLSVTSSPCLPCEPYLCFTQVLRKYFPREWSQGSPCDIGTIVLAFGKIPYKGVMFYCYGKKIGMLGVFRKELCEWWVHFQMGQTNSI